MSDFGLYKKPWVIASLSCDDLFIDIGCIVGFGVIDINPKFSCQTWNVEKWLESRVIFSKNENTSTTLSALHCSAKAAEKGQKKTYACITWNCQLFFDEEPAVKYFRAFPEEEWTKKAAFP